MVWVKRTGENVEDLLGCGKWGEKELWGVIVDELLRLDTWVMKRLFYCFCKMTSRFSG